MHLHSLRPGIVIIMVVEHLSIIPRQYIGSVRLPRRIILLHLTILGYVMKLVWA